MTHRNPPAEIANPGTMLGVQLNTTVSNTLRDQFATTNTTCPTTIVIHNADTTGTLGVELRDAKGESYAYYNADSTSATTLLSILTTAPYNTPLYLAH